MSERGLHQQEPGLLRAGVKAVTRRDFSTKPGRLPSQPNQGALGVIRQCVEAENLTVMSSTTQPICGE